MGLKDFFRDRNQANPILNEEVRKAITDVWDRWGVDGLAAVQYYQPMLDNATYEIVQKEFEEGGI